jgi:histidinol-phosphatase (PHP family)
MPKMALYREEIKALKEKYKGQLDIFCGLEYDAYSDFDTAGFDYLIGSVHYLDCGETIATFDRGVPETAAFIDTYFGGDGLAFAKKYFETVATLPEKRTFDIVGHFDLPVKNNDKGHFFDTSSKEYLNYGFEAIHALCGKIPLFEVNTGAMSAGHRKVPYPEMAFLRELRACGFGAVITSDSHRAETLDAGFAEAAEALREAGFSSKWILTDKGFKEIEL